MHSIITQVFRVTFFTEKILYNYIHLYGLILETELLGYLTFVIINIYKTKHKRLRSTFYDHSLLT